MHDELLRRLNETKTMSIVGMCKNAGKTTTVSYTHLALSPALSV